MENSLYFRISDCSFMKKIVLLIFMSTSMVLTSEAKYPEEGHGPENNQSSNALKNRNSFSKEKIVITSGYAFPNFYNSIYSNIKTDFPESERSSLGPIFLRGEYGFHNRWGVGLHVRFANSQITYPQKGAIYDAENNPIRDTTFSYNSNASNIAVMARINYHFSTTPKIDPYVGVGVGYGHNLIKWDFSTDKKGKEYAISKPSPIAFEVTCGIRYYITDVVGIYAEGGYSASLLNGGVAFKF